MSATDLSTTVNLAQSDRQYAITFYRYEDPTAPNTWRLVNLIFVARKVPSTKIIDPPDAIRAWRNIIHPAKARAEYPIEAELSPESITASGFLAAIRRDIQALLK